MQQIEAQYDLDISAFISKMNTVSNRLGTVEDSLTGIKQKDPFAAQAQSATKLNQTLSQQVSSYQRVQAVETSLFNERKRLETQLESLKKKQLAFIAAGRYGELKTQIKQVETALERISEPLKKADSLWDRIKAKFSRGIDIPATRAPGLSGSGKSNPLSGAASGAADQLAGAVGVSLSTAGIVAAVGATVVKGTKEWADYGKKLSEVSAITGATGKALQFLDDQAVQIEADTGIAGTVILDAFKSIGSIKPELLESNAALAQTTKEVIALSQASGLDLQQAAISLLGSINQFGEGADQAARFANVLAAGAKYGASEINETSEALKAAGTTMKATGVSFEQGNALVQSLAGVMIKGSEAGTALRNVLLKLETSADKNLRPSVVGLDAALENASKKFTTTTSLTKEFGLENVVAARRILDTRAEVVKMTKDITGTSVAYEQARINTDNLATDLEKAGSSITGFFRGLASSQDGFIRYAVQSFAFFVNSISSKTGVLRAVLSSLFSGKGILAASIAGATQSAINAGTEARRVQNQNVKDTANREVNTSVDTRADQLTKSGLAKDNAAVQAASEEYERRQTQLTKVRKQYNDTADALKTATGEARKRLLEDGKLDALALKQAKENQSVAATVLGRTRKDKADRAAALKLALGEKPSDADKKADDKALKARQDSYNLLLDARKEYQSELTKLEQQYGKEQLENLDHNTEEYINRKAQLDKDAIEVERKHLEELYRISVATTTRINKATNKREAVTDPNVKLPESTGKIYDNRSAAVTAEANRKIEELRYQHSLTLLKINRQFDELEVEEVRHKWEEIIKAELLGFTGNTQQRTKLEADLRAKQKADEDRVRIGQAITQIRSQEEISLAFVDTNRFADETRAEKQNALGIVNLEAEKERKRLQIRIESGEKLITYLREQGEKENAVLIAQTQAAIDALKRQQADFKTLDTSSGAGFFGSLLGLGGEELDQFKKALASIGESINATAQIQIQASEQRISALESEISAKEEQIRTEQERDKEGYANNLALRQAELQNLKQQKAEEQRVRANAVRQQQALDLISTTSTNIATTADLIATAAKAMKGVAGIPVVGIFLAVAAAASIFATIASFKAKAQALSQPVTQLRKGGRIPLSGRSHELGGHRIEGTDIEVERGEHVTNARSSERFNDALEALNRNDAHAAIRAMMKQAGIGLPPLVVQQIQQPGFNRSAATIDFSGMAATLGEHSDLLKVLIANTANIPESQLVSLGDGRILEKTGNRTTITSHGKP